MLVLKMKFTKQHKRLTVVNLDNVIVKKNVKQKHGPLLPNSIRSLIVGPSNCGKTNCMLSLLFDLNGLKYENIYIYSKTLHQPKYGYLAKVITTIPELSIYMFSNNCDVISPDDAKPNSIFIFDDVACEKQKKICSYYCLGRHKNIDSFYLCQTYTRIPKHLIRDNANMICIFKQDDMNLRHIFNDHINNDITYAQFNDACNKCWTDNHGFMVIMKDSPLHNGRYRKGFDNFISFEK